MLEIPELNISVTKAAVNGKVYEVIDYEEYRKNFNMYNNRTDVAISTEYQGKEILLPIKGKYVDNPISPGVYNAGVIDLYKYPEKEFVDKYVPKDKICMKNTDDIATLIKNEEESKKLDEPFITTPDNITNIPIRENDQPEMKGLKMALNAKKIDLDKYASRFGANFPNDKRQLKSNSATLVIIKRYCNNCDMEAVLTFKDKNPDVPNPMNKEISISLTNLDEDINVEDYIKSNTNIDDDDDENDYENCDV